MPCLHHERDSLAYPNTVEIQREAGERRRGAYHGVLSKSADLLDGTRSTLLEGDTVGL